MGHWKDLGPLGKALKMKKKILLIDDSPFFLTALSDFLAKDFLVEKANSGEMAIEMLTMHDQDRTAHAGSFDLVITDLEMQGKTGFDVAQFVKHKNRKMKFTPVILLTGKNITKEEAREYGCATCLPKTNLQKILSMVKILFPG